MLKRAVAYRRWRPKARREDPPPEELFYYRHERRVHTKSAIQFVKILKGYFEIAKKGDLALVPPSAWKSDALLIEFSTDPHDFIYREVPYGKDYLVDMPVRRFREIGTVQKRFLPRHILDVVTKPNGFIQFGKPDTNDLTHLVYDDFSKDNKYTSKFHVREHECNLEYDFYFAASVKVVSSNIKASSEGAGEPYSFEAAIRGDFSDYAPTLQSNVNSPGWLRLSDYRITPLVVSVLFALAVHVGNEAVQAAQDGQITIGNSKAPDDDPCVAQVCKETLDFLKFLRLDDWAPACELARKANAGGGVRSQSKVSLPGDQ